MHIRLCLICIMQVALVSTAPPAVERATGAPSVVTNKTSVFTPDHIKTILDGHNEARRLENAKTMPDLKWNAELAIKAQNWTDGCKFAHQPPRVRRWGENIAAVGNTRPIPSQLTAMITEWVDEKKFNTNGTFEECCSFRASDCCHYTQVVWAKTTDVGCGYTVCQDLEYGSNQLTNIAFLACYYTPSGNSPVVTYDWRPYLSANITLP
ncbi:Cysteine-rich secretory protein LCCL domain-containing 1 [Bulinus truncatus]|nr:Cysteine-rich secretory protein LCCL domain-containing 1 [Bulinus truncatus]